MRPKFVKGVPAQVLCVDGSVRNAVVGDKVEIPSGHYVEVLEFSEDLAKVKDLASGHKFWITTGGSTKSARPYKGSYDWWIERSNQNDDEETSE